MFTSTCGGSRTAQAAAMRPICRVNGNVVFCTIRVQKKCKITVASLSKTNTAMLRRYSVFSSTCTINTVIRAAMCALTWSSLSARTLLFQLSLLLWNRWLNCSGAPDYVATKIFVKRHISPMCRSVKTFWSSEMWNRLTNLTGKDKPLRLLQGRNSVRAVPEKLGAIRVRRNRKRTPIEKVMTKSF